MRAPYAKRTAFRARSGTLRGIGGHATNCSPRRACGHETGIAWGHNAVAKSKGGGSSGGAVFLEKYESFRRAKTAPPDLLFEVTLINYRTQNTARGEQFCASNCRKQARDHSSARARRTTNFRGPC